MQRTRSRARMLVLLVLLVPASVASAKGLCARGRFELGGVTGRDAAALGGVVLSFDKGTVALEGMCSATAVGLSYYYGDWQYRTRLRLDERCGTTLARALMRIRFDPHECATLKGRLRTPHGRTRFTAHRLPTCGNDRIEDGETCDDGNFDGGDCCDPSCRMEPGCSGPCERTSDCNPAALCIRQSTAPVAGCLSTPGQCGYEPPASREHLCPSNPPSNAPGVCGCDRRVYRTNCDAWAAGVSVADVGGCPCDGATGGVCPEGYRCDLTERPYICDPQLRSGVCVPVDPSCLDVTPLAVCGCDGVTYPSDCARQKAHVDFFGFGPCSSP